MAMKGSFHIRVGDAGGFEQGAMRSAFDAAFDLV